MHLSLQAWRRQMVSELKRQLLGLRENPTRDGVRRRSRLSKNLEDYKKEIFTTAGEHIHERSKEAACSMMCQPVGTMPQPHWNCVLHCCSNCPKHVVPKLEQATGLEAPAINFHACENATTCTHCNLLPLHSKVCPQCKEKKDVMQRKNIPINSRSLGKVRTRKTLILKKQSICSTLIVVNQLSMLSAAIFLM